MHVPSTNTTSVDRCRGFGTCMSLELGASVTVVVVYGVVMNASHYERAIIFFWRPEMHTKLPQKPQTIEISKLFPIIENDLAHFFLHGILSQILWFYGVYGKL